MREVRVTGGYNDPLITDVGGLDLTGVVAKGALVTEGDPWPAANAAAWVPLELEDNGGTAVVSQLVTSSQAVGHFHWWLQLTVGPLVLLLCVRDPEDPDRPWHIWVH